jgi:hypothetical protein
VSAPDVGLARNKDLRLARCGSIGGR